MGQPQPQAVTCDECGAEFAPAPYERREKGGVQMRFDCPSCHHGYDVAFITTAGVKLRRQLGRARKRGDADEARRLEAAYQEQVTVASRA